MNGHRIRDELALREASIADARRELAAGEMDEERFQAIERRERSAMTKLTEQLATVSNQPIHRGTRRRKSSRLVLGLSLITLAALGFTALHVSIRQAGTSITGGVSVNAAQRVAQLLNEAEVDSASNNNLAALSAYQAALAIDPSNITALTESGWLTFSAGSASHSATLVQAGARELRRAVDLAPALAAPHLYYGLVAAVTPGNTTLARTQLAAFVHSHPTATQLAIARPYLRRLKIRF